MWSARRGSGRQQPSIACSYRTRSISNSLSSEQSAGAHTLYRHCRGVCSQTVRGSRCHTRVVIDGAVYLLITVYWRPVLLGYRLSTSVLYNIRASRPTPVSWRVAHAVGPTQTPSRLDSPATAGTRITTPPHPTTTTVSRRQRPGDI